MFSLFLVLMFVFLSSFYSLHEFTQAIGRHQDHIFEGAYLNTLYCQGRQEIFAAIMITVAQEILDQNGLHL